jgi:hypothetical protein
MPANTSLVNLYIGGRPVSFNRNLYNNSIQKPNITPFLAYESDTDGEGNEVLVPRINVNVQEKTPNTVTKLSYSIFDKDKICYNSGYTDISANNGDSFYLGKPGNVLANTSLYVSLRYRDSNGVFGVDSGLIDISEQSGNSDPIKPNSTDWEISKLAKFITQPTLRQSPAFVVSNNSIVQQSNTAVGDCIIVVAYSAFATPAEGGNTKIMTSVFSGNNSLYFNRILYRIANTAGNVSLGIWDGTNNSIQPAAYGIYTFVGSSIDSDNPIFLPSVYNNTSANTFQFPSKNTSSNTATALLVQCQYAHNNAVVFANQTGFSVGWSSTTSIYAKSQHLYSNVASYAANTAVAHTSGSSANTLSTSFYVQGKSYFTPVVKIPQTSPIYSQIKTTTVPSAVNEGGIEFGQFQTNEDESYPQTDWKSQEVQSVTENGVTKRVFNIISLTNPPPYLERLYNTAMAGCYIRYYRQSDNAFSSRSSDLKNFTIGSDPNFQTNIPPSYDGGLTNQNVVNGQSYARNVVASFSGTSLTYSLSTAPTGFSINSTTGLITANTGWSLSAGNYTITVVATDNQNRTASGSYTIAVTASGGNVVTITNESTLRTALSNASNTTIIKFPSGLFSLANNIFSYAYNNFTVTLQPSDRNSPPILRSMVLTAAKNIVIDGFNFTGTTINSGTAIRMNSGTNLIRVVDCTISNTQYGIVLGGTPNITLEYNTIRNIGTDFIEPYFGCDNIIIRGNDMRSPMGGSYTGAYRHPDFMQFATNTQQSSNKGCQGILIEKNILINDTQSYQADDSSTTAYDPLYIQHIFLYNDSLRLDTNIVNSGTNNWPTCAHRNVTIRDNYSEGNWYTGIGLAGIIGGNVYRNCLRVCANNMPAIDDHRPTIVFYVFNPANGGSIVRSENLNVTNNVVAKPMNRVIENGGTANTMLVANGTISGNIVDSGGTTWPTGWKYGTSRPPAGAYADRSNETDD